MTAVVDRLRALGSATLHEAIGKLGALPSQIKPIDSGWRLAGPAYPVATAPHNNVFLHDAIYAAPAGSVIVASASGARESGYWGEIMSCAAQVRGLAGLVIDGCVRDGALLRELGFPVFATGLCIQGTGKARDAAGRLNAPVVIGTVTVQPGDFVVGDIHGVVVVPADEALTAAEAGEKREREEEAILRRLREGETTLDIYRLRPRDEQNPARVGG